MGTFKIEIPTTFNLDPTDELEADADKATSGREPTAHDPEDEKIADLDAAADKARSVQVFKSMTTARKMRVLSEAALDDAMPWHMTDGESYHAISYGDVDSLTYLRHIVRQERVDYLLLSTWCMAMEDAREIGEWVDRGMVGRVDFYVGEIFKNGYRGVRDALEDVARKCGGRVCRFRNHSKVMAGFGERFDFAIESSANVNTNPRCEQTCITIDTGLAEFFKEWYDGMRPFDKGFEDWAPWERDA